MNCGSLENMISAAAQTPSRCMPEGAVAHVLFQVRLGGGGLPTPEE